MEKTYSWKLRSLYVSLVGIYAVMKLIAEYGFMREKEYTVPPKGMIIDAILVKYIVMPMHHQTVKNKEEYQLPENLKVFLSQLIKIADKFSG